MRNYWQHTNSASMVPLVLGLDANYKTLSQTHSFLFPQIPQWLLSYLVAVLTINPTGEVSGGACPRVEGGKNVVSGSGGSKVRL